MLRPANSSHFLVTRLEGAILFAGRSVKVDASDKSRLMVHLWWKSYLSESLKEISKTKGSVSLLGDVRHTSGFYNTLFLLKCELCASRACRSLFLVVWDSLWVDCKKNLRNCWFKMKKKSIMNEKNTERFSRFELNSTIYI